MDLIKVSQLFDVSYGVNLALNKMRIVNKGIPFVSRCSTNNGVPAFVEKIDTIDPNPPDTISVAVGGSVLESFYQPEPYYSGYHLFYLKPKIKLTQEEMLFYCICLKKNRYRYSYERQANKTLADLFLPAPNELPQYLRELKVKRPTEKRIWSRPASKIKNSLEATKWEWFLYKDIFEIKGSKTTSIHNLKECGKGKYPYIITQSTNSGVRDFYSCFTENKDRKSVIAVDSATVGFCSYHEDPFSTSDHVEVLIPKVKIDKYIGIFLVTLLSMEQYRFNYGRKRNQERLQNSKVKLPIDKKGDPDWQLMGNWIKSLPYSGNLLV